MFSPCEVVERLQQPTLVVRTHTPVSDLSQALGQAYGQVMQALGSLGEHPVGAPFVAYFNMDMQDLEIEAGFPVRRPMAGQAGVQASAVPGGKLARVLYTGPYQEIGSAYEALAQWVAENGYEATGVSYEFYLNDPEVTAPENLQTEVLFPLKAES